MKQTPSTVTQSGLRHIRWEGCWYSAYMLTVFVFVCLCAYVPMCLCAYAFVSLYNHLLMFLSVYLFSFVGNRPACLEWEKGGRSRYGPDNLDAFD